MIKTVPPPKALLAAQPSAEDRRIAMRKNYEQMRSYRGDADQSPKHPDELRFTLAGNVFWNRHCTDHLTQFLLRSFYCEIKPLPSDQQSRNREIGRRCYLAAEIIYESVLFDMRDCLPQGCPLEADHQEQAKQMSDLFYKAFVFEFLPRYEKCATPSFTCSEVIDFISNHTLN